MTPSIQSCASSARFVLSHPLVREFQIFAGEIGPDEGLHTAVRDAAAKGKIERFFRRVRDQFLVKKLDLSSLETLNRQFTQWVEADYNGMLHDAIGMKPIDRFGIDVRRVRFLAPCEHSDELFYAEADRKVKKDNTFSFDNRRYESPVDYRDRTIQIRFDRRRLETTPVIIYYNGQRQGPARLLDAVANGLRRHRGAHAPYLHQHHQNPL